MRVVVGWVSEVAFELGGGTGVVVRCGSAVLEVVVVDSQRRGGHEAMSGHGRREIAFLGNREFAVQLAPAGAMPFGMFMVHRGIVTLTSLHWPGQPKSPRLPLTLLIFQTPSR